VVADSPRRRESPREEHEEASPPETVNVLPAAASRPADNPALNPYQVVTGDKPPQRSVNGRGGDISEEELFYLFG
jgi:hypothetical protein